MFFRGCRARSCVPVWIRFCSEERGVWWLNRRQWRGAGFVCSREKQQGEALRHVWMLVAAIRASSELRDLELGKRVHGDAIWGEKEADIYVASTLVSMYAKCGSMIEAREVFDRMQCQNVVAWNALMLGYVDNGEEERALDLFASMEFSKDARTYGVAIKACSNLAAKEQGRLKIDEKIVKLEALRKGMTVHCEAELDSGFEWDVFMGSSLIGMYAKCGSMLDARRVFDRMKYHDVVAWTALILGYVENGEEELALDFFARMEHEGCAADARTLVAALKGCTSLAGKEAAKEVNGKLVKLQCLDRGRRLHFEASKRGLDLDIFVSSTLIDMYSKCGSVVDARKVFDRMVGRNVVSWNVMMLGYVENGDQELALDLFDCMRSRGCAPDARSFVAALKACSILAANEEVDRVGNRLVKFEALERTTRIHREIQRTGFERDLFVTNTLLDTYIKCGSLVEALRLFGTMPATDVVSLTTIMQGYVDCGHADSALSLFESLSFAPDAPVLVVALRACSILALQEPWMLIYQKNSNKKSDLKKKDQVVKLDAIQKGMHIHSKARECGCELDISFANTAVDMYAKCGSMLDARIVFDRMLHHTIVSWNTLISGYAGNHDEELAVELFERMLSEALCAPDHLTLVAVFKACSSLAAKEAAAHANGNHVKMKALEKGMRIHSQASLESEKNMLVANTLLDMYAKCGSMVDSGLVFSRMASPTVVSWNALILGYVDNGESETALDVFQYMQNSAAAVPDARTLVAALKACGNLAALQVIKTINAAVCRMGMEEEDAVIVSCLVDVYGKCGSMVEAQLMFDRSTLAHEVASWNALLGGYCCQGDTKVVLEVFGRMEAEGVKPDEISFVSALTACSRGGLVNQAKSLLRAMTGDKYGLEASIEHYHCVVDTLGRANQLDDAVLFAKAMPFRPNFVTWLTLLGACWKWKNAVLGREAFDLLVAEVLSSSSRAPRGVVVVQDVDMDSAVAGYALMVNIFRSLGMWKEERSIETLMIKEVMPAYRRCAAEEE